MIFLESEILKVGGKKEEKCPYMDAVRADFEKFVQVAMNLYFYQNRTTYFEIGLTLFKKISFRYSTDRRVNLFLDV